MKSLKLLALAVLPFGCAALWAWSARKGEQHLGVAGGSPEPAISSKEGSTVTQRALPLRSTLQGLNEGGSGDQAIPMQLDPIEVSEAPADLFSQCERQGWEVHNRHLEAHRNHFMRWPDPVDPDYLSRHFDLDLEKVRENMVLFELIEEEHRFDINAAVDRYIAELDLALGQVFSQPPRRLELAEDGGLTKAAERVLDGSFHTVQVLVDGVAYAYTLRLGDFPRLDQAIRERTLSVNARDASARALANELQ